MTKEEFDLGAWFGCLQTNLLDRCGVNYKNQKTAREAYDSGLDVHGVIEDLCEFYGEYL